MPTTNLSITSVTYVRQDTATTNYNGTLSIGETNNGDNSARRGILNFGGLTDGTIPSTSTVVSVILKIAPRADLSDNARTFRTYRLKRNPVYNQCTWNIYSTGNNWSSAGAFGANDCEQTDIGTCSFTASETLNVYKEFSLTPSAIQEIVRGTYSINHLLVKADTELNDGYNFNSISDPYPPILTVEWSYSSGGVIMM